MSHPYDDHHHSPTVEAQMIAGGDQAQAQLAADGKTVRPVTCFADPDTGRACAANAFATRTLVAVRAYTSALRDYLFADPKDRNPDYAAFAEFLTVSQ